MTKEEIIKIVTSLVSDAKCTIVTNKWNFVKNEDELLAVDSTGVLVFDCDLDYTKLPFRDIVEIKVS